METPGCPGKSLSSLKPKGGEKYPPQRFDFRGEGTGLPKATVLNTSILGSCSQAPSLSPQTPGDSQVNTPAPFSFPPTRASSQEQNSCLGLCVLLVALTQSRPPPAAPLPATLTPHLLGPLPRAPGPTLFFLPKGQSLARLRAGVRPSEGAPRLLSEAARFMRWLKSSNSTSPGRAKPDLCSSTRTWESWGW